MKWYIPFAGVVLGMFSVEGSENTVEVCGKTQVTFPSIEVLKKRLLSAQLADFCEKSAIDQALGEKSLSTYRCVIEVDIAIVRYNEYCEKNKLPKMTDGCKEKIFNAILQDNPEVFAFLKKERFYKEKDTCEGGS